MVHLLSEIFAERDPPAVAVGLNPTEFETFVRLFCPQAADQGLTIVARCAETEEMCGALLTEDSASELSEGIDRLSAKFNPIFDILQTVIFRACWRFYPCNTFWMPPDFTCRNFNTAITAFDCISSIYQ